MTSDDDTLPMSIMSITYACGVHLKELCIVQTGQERSSSQIDLPVLGDTCQTGDGCVWEGGRGRIAAWEGPPGQTTEMKSDQYLY